jgi:hypothetical protein
MQKSNRFLWMAGVSIVFLMVGAVSAYVWYYLPRTCEVTAVEEASAILVSLVKRYDDVYQVATDAPQNAVFIPVSVMQQNLMDTQQVVVPACMKIAKRELLNYMETVIRAFQAYSAQEADTMVRGLIDQSETHYAKFSAELKDVKKCAPYCVPKVTLFVVR